MRRKRTLFFTVVFLSLVLCSLPYNIPEIEAITETRYFRSNDDPQVLNTTQTATEDNFEVNSTSHPSYFMWYASIRVYVIFQAGGEKELTTTYSAIAERLWTGYDSEMWTSPQTALNETDKIRVSLYGHVCTDAWQFAGNWTTEELGTEILYTSQWTVTYKFEKVENDGGTDYYYIVWGASTANTRIQGFSYQTFYEYTFYGLYDESTGLLCDASERAVNITAYFVGNASYTFELNGSYSYSPSIHPLFFRFDLGSKKREYWLSNTEYQSSIYVFNDTLTTYTIDFMDLAGALEDSPIVTAKRYVNETLHTVEKRKVDVEEKIQMSLVNGEKYTVSIQDGSSYVYGDLLMTDTTTITLTLKGIEFPKETLMTSKFVRVYALQHDWRTAEAIDQQQTSRDTAGDIYGNNYRAQNYTVGKTGFNQTKISIRGYKFTATPEDDFYVEIRKDDSNEPDMTASGLVANATVAKGAFPATDNWFDCDHTDFTLTETTYWIVAKSPSTTNDNKYIWSYKNDGNPYTKGVYAVSNDAGDTWSFEGDFDYTFKTYYGYQVRSISCLYEDLKENTNSVELTFKYRNGTTAYQPDTQFTNSFNVTWATALANTDYRLELSIDHETYGTWTWKQYFPRAYSESPWGLGFLGELPFDTAVIIPAILILFAAGCFSQINPDVGAFMAVVVAAAIAYLGWISIGPAGLVVAFVLAVIMALINAKRRIQT